MFRQIGLPPTNEPIRLAIRRVRWFRAAFRSYVEALGKEIGCRFEVDEPRLTSVFVRWLRAIDHQKPRDRSRRRAFLEFASSLMLSELTRTMPITLIARSSGGTSDGPAEVWPEGYACTAFCLAVHATAMQQEFAAATHLQQKFGEPDFWWTFKENAEDDPRLTAGFLQAILGNEPNWNMPGDFGARRTQVH